MKITLINPPLCGIKGDIYGNIPSFPIGLAYLAAAVRENSHHVEIIDCYGLAPTRKFSYNSNIQTWGIGVSTAVKLINSDVDLVGISIHSIAEYSISKALIKAIKEERKIPIVVGGSCATTMYQDFLRAGADFVILSEGEESFVNLINAIKSNSNLDYIDGIAYGDKLFKKTKFIEDLDKLPMPAFDLLPLENYWALKYAHGPVSGRYLTLISSRGCPFNCNFCASPSIWQRKWRAQSPKRVVDEIEYFLKKYKVSNFQFQDDAFTNDDRRVIDISQEIINRDLNISWSLPAGVKVETLGEVTLDIMKKSGFNYISVSPETGSKKVLKFMNKNVDFEHMARIISHCDDLGIKTQACFVLGYPGEGDEDIKKSKGLLKRLMKCGLDEIVIPIITPLPGARLNGEFSANCNYEELCFSPRWRKDYKRLNRERIKFYLIYALYKMIFSPNKVARSLVNICTKKFETKAEMTIYRIFKSKIMPN